MGPQNIVMGDDYGIGVPQTTIDEAILNEEEKLAKYSKTKEFKRLKQYLEQRIAHYQRQLPNGEEITTASQVDVNDWVIANTVIREFKNVINQYEAASEVVSEAKR